MERDTINALQCDSLLLRSLLPHWKAKRKGAGERGVRPRVHNSSAFRQDVLPCLPPSLSPSLPELAG
jgi:hypothetical protein